MSLLELARAGYNFDNEIVCVNCASDEENSNAEESEILTNTFVYNSDEELFCHRCGKAL